MFTGIIEEVGAIKQITHGQHSEVLNIQARTVLENTKIGDSIAVNGICLTVTRLFADSFSADVMHETLNRSSLAGLMVGSKVNLERAMAADGRFGGHIVAGHVDGTGCILRIEKRRQCGLVYHPCGTESFALCRGKRLHRGRWYKPDGGRSQFGCVFSVHHPSHRQLYKSVSKAQKRCGKSGDRHPWQVCRKAVSADTAGTPAKLCHERNADTLRI